jgi:hypothetical protein
MVGIADGISKAVIMFPRLWTRRLPARRARPRRQPRPGDLRRGAGRDHTCSRPQRWTDRDCGHPFGPVQDGLRLRRAGEVTRGASSKCFAISGRRRVARRRHRVGARAANIETITDPDASQSANAPGAHLLVRHRRTYTSCCPSPRAQDWRNDCNESFGGPFAKSATVPLRRDRHVAAMVTE